MELFGTAGIRGDAVERVTPDLALRVGRAAGADGSEFVVGYDGRVTSPGLGAALTAGLTSAGVRVLRVGQVPTPALAWASQGRRGAMITASHNPPTDNGIKLFVDGQEYDAPAERQVGDRVAAAEDPVAWDQWGQPDDIDVLADYRRTIVDYAVGHGAEPEETTVAVDSGNGMSGVATPQVLGALGADVRAVEANVDGHFPARESKPTPETLSTFRRFVADTDVDLGIAHDGDSDRIVVVDRSGAVVHEDTILAILGEHYTRTATAADPVVVTTPNASARVDDRVEAAGGRVERVHLGALHEGIERVRAEGDTGTAVVFAGEPWKHIHPALGGWIDGVASAAVLVRLFAATPLAKRRENVIERPYRKVSVDCPDDAKTEAMTTLAETLPDRFPEATVSTEYGVRLTFADGAWTLVRPSGTEPYVRVYAESEDVDALVDRVVETVRGAVAEET